ncbi:MAG: phosphoribosylaminoimidazolesuccinocarboxamide synthase [Oligoflexales bacterium]
MRSIRSFLQEIKERGYKAEDLARYSFKGLGQTQKAELEKKGIDCYSGKVREVLGITKDKLFIVHTDRLSAFDKHIAHIPFKGRILCEFSRFWLEKSREVLPTHLIREYDERTLETERLRPFKAEVVVRGYMAGSMARAYAAGRREFCGQTLPEGLKQYCKLKDPIITPTTKAAVFEHDEEVAPKELIKRGVCTEKEWSAIAEYALALFALGQKIYESKNWLLVDTKYEFGFTDKGEIKLIDELHTPDSSRFWVKDSYARRLAAGDVPEMFDKEIVRRYLIDKGFSGEGPIPQVEGGILIDLCEAYLDVAEDIVGKEIMATGAYNCIIGSVT